MNVTALIRKKRDGEALSAREIRALIEGYVNGTVPDYQMSAFAMAVCLRGMTTAETAALTEAKLNSGQVMRWENVGAKVVDKHSTGGIGDKVSLVLAPLLACEGLLVPMISGRGLGPTGGTLDKLESIAGFRTDLSLEEIQRLTREVGCVITGATIDIAPADKHLYSLRDVTATVESIPLITASIMSKKLAAGLDALVLDVKFGSGAFMKNIDDARALAKSLVATGQQMGVRTSALLTDMNQPLGRMVGNAAEVHESIDALRGKGPSDLMEVTLQLGAELLRLADAGDDIDANMQRLQSHIDSGAALEKFHKKIAAQQGNIEQITPLATAHELACQRNGYITCINTQQLGEAVIELGGGRKVKTDRIDHSVGLEMLVRIGDRVALGQPIVRLFTDVSKFAHVSQMVTQAITIGDMQIQPPQLIAERIDGAD